MKRRLMLKSLAAFGLSLPLSGLPLALSANNQHLIMGTTYNNRHPITRELVLPWCESVKKQSDERLNISISEAGKVYAETEIVHAIITGQLSMGVICPSMTIPALPVSTFFGSPLLFPSAEAGSLVLWELLQSYPPLQQDYNLVKVLWAWSSLPILLHTTSRPVADIDNLKGLKLITWSAMDAEIIKNLGATPILALPSNSSYMIQRGIADGLLCPLPALGMLNITHLLKYTTDIPLNRLSFFMCMNREIWNGMSGDLQKIFIEKEGQNQGRLISKQSGYFLDQEELRIKKVLLNSGYKFVKVPTQNMDRWDKTITTMRNNHIDRLKAFNIAGTENILAITKQCLDKVSLELSL